MIDLKSMSLPEMEEYLRQLGEPRFRAGQVFEWIQSRRAVSFDGMTNLSKAGRERLKELYDTGVTAPAGFAESVDGTRKYLFPVSCPMPGGMEDSAVEAVVIPDADRKTLCVSSQAGCKMGCRFCMTGRQGFHGHLSAAQILNQFVAIPESQELTNAVFMGMGEPLDNYDAVMRAIEVLTSDWCFGWSPKRITLSTIGVLPNLRRYLDECKCHLAVSVHNPFPEERFSIMPVQKVWPLRDVVD